MRDQKKTYVPVDASSVPVTDYNYDNELFSVIEHKWANKAWSIQLYNVDSTGPTPSLITIYASNDNANWIEYSTATSNLEFDNTGLAIFDSEFCFRYMGIEILPSGGTGNTVSIIMSI